MFFVFKPRKSRKIDMYTVPNDSTTLKPQKKEPHEGQKQADAGPKKEQRNENGGRREEATHRKTSKKKKPTASQGGRVGAENA